MEMKNSKEKRYIKSLVLLIMVMLVIFCSFFLIHRMSGKIAVTVQGERELVTDLECRSSSLERQDRILYIGSSPIFFMNSGLNHDMYEYSFTVRNGEINVMPRIQVFKTNALVKYNLDIGVDIVKAGEVWNGDISVKVNGRTYTESFADIEHNAMMIRVE